MTLKIEQTIKSSIIALTIYSFLLLFLTFLPAVADLHWIFNIMIIQRVILFIWCLYNFNVWINIGGKTRS